MRRGLAIAVLAGLVWTGLPVVGAADESVDQPRADTVAVLDGTFEIMRPTGWMIVAPDEGAAAVFRSETDDQAQIEVRISDSIPERRWERYWRAFDTELQEAGFEVVQPRRRDSWAGQQGLSWEYELEHEGEDYRLMVWHTHERDRAWVFSAFFQAERRQAYEQTFEELLESMEWE